MKKLSIKELEAVIDAALEGCELTQGLKITVWKTEVVFEDGNNWMSYIEPDPSHFDSFQPTPEAKKMIQKLLGDMRLKYNLI